MLVQGELLMARFALRSGVTAEKVGRYGRAIVAILGAVSTVHGSLIAVSIRCRRLRTASGPDSSLPSHCVKDRLYTSAISCTALSGVTALVGPACKDWTRSSQSPRREQTYHISQSSGYLGVVLHITRRHRIFHAVECSSVVACGGLH
jgi:hypothetical protein